MAQSATGAGVADRRDSVPHAVVAKRSRRGTPVDVVAVAVFVARDGRGHRCQQRATVAFAPLPLVGWVVPGKTSLLNALAGRVPLTGKNDKLSGTIIN